MKAFEPTVRPAIEADAPRQAYIQRVCFPTLSEEEIILAEHFAFHAELFPEGQFVACDGDLVVGTTSSIQYDFDPAHPGHRFLDIFDKGWFRTHNPNGRWLYGMDLGVLPEYRGWGVARLLYRARQEVVRSLGLAGQVTVGMLNGYALFHNLLTIEEYYARLEAGILKDPTVSAQLAVGFEMKGLISNYLSDPTCGNAGALLVLEAGKTI